jgi:hypothetical protein
MTTTVTKNMTKTKKKSENLILRLRNEKGVSWSVTPEMEKIEQKRKFIPARTSKSCCIFHAKIDNQKSDVVPGVGWVQTFIG